jgi:hypothetical protein
VADAARTAVEPFRVALMKRVPKWLIPLVVVLVVLVVGDRVAVAVAENRASSSVEDRAAVSAVSVDVHGFPFLTQIAGGNLSHVTGSADSATFGGLSVTDVQIDARDVEISSPYRVAHGTASGAIPVATLEAMLKERTGLDLTVTAKGDSLTLSGTVLGVDLSLDGVPTVKDPTSLGVTITAVRMGGAAVSIDALPAFLADPLTDVHLGLDLPAGITLDSVQVSGDSVRVAVVGTDVALKDLVAS